jgi:hypothetical protein
MTQLASTDQQSGGGNEESFSSMASFVSALLEEKMQNSLGSCSFDSLSVDIIDDNARKYVSDSRHPTLHQSLVRMRRPRSNRQLSRWANTFEPHDSAPELLTSFRKKDLLRTVSVDTLRVPQRKASPRLRSRSFAKPTKTASSNAVWTNEDVLNSSQRRTRMSDLFDLTLTLSPENEAKVLQVGVKNKKHTKLLIPFDDGESTTGKKPSVDQMTNLRGSNALDNAPVLPGRPRASDEDSNP